MRDLEEATELNLDNVRDFLYVALRAQERFTSNLKVLVEDLDKRKDEDEWLEQVLDEADKGFLFYESQQQNWQGFLGQVQTYVASVRKIADELAIEEMQVEKKDHNEKDTDDCSDRRKARTIHPELKKFKLEKQARILGKYGGVPAMGSGMVMGLPPKDVILKATASPAAREIQYSKIEDKDARYLAEVMQFKTRKSRLSGSGGGTSGNDTLAELLGEEPEKSPWQAEMIERKGKHFFKQHETPPESTSTMQSPYAAELSAKLRQQQEALAAAEASAAAPKKQEVPSIAASATSELADKLKKQQISLKHSEEEQARAAKEAAAEAAGVPTPSTTWSNAASPFGQELSSVLSQRTQQQRSAAAAAVVTPNSIQKASGNRDDDDGGVSPGFSFRAASHAIAGSNTPSTPAVRRPAGMTAITPAAATNELAEILKRRAAKQAETE